MSDLPPRKRLRDYAIDNARIGQPSSVEFIDDEMARRFEAMAAAMPPNIQAKLAVISGERTPARQIEVYRKLGKPPPMDSRHIHRAALDLRDDPEVLDWINQYGRPHGLGFPLRHMPNEQNHMEMIDPDTGERVGLGNLYATNPGAGVKTGMRRFGVAEANLPKPDLALSPDLAAAVTPSVPSPQEDLAARLQIQREDPFAKVAENSLSGLLTQGMQPAPVQPQPILQPQPTVFGGPLPLARRLI